MAAIFCLFNIALCKFSDHDTSQSSFGLRFNDDTVKENSVSPLSAQFVTVPRVYISPCPESFRYTFNGKEWFGLVVIEKPALFEIPYRIKVQLSVGIRLSAVSFYLIYEFKG